MDNNGSRRSASNRDDGEILWRRSAPETRIARGHRTNSATSPTPVVDGETVYVYFGSYGLLAYDFDGNLRWQRRLPARRMPWGVGSSPVLAGDTLLLNQDQDEGAHLLALDAATGATRWRADRPEFRRGFSTPLVLRQIGQVVVSGSNRIAAYDLEDGSEIWTVRGLPYQVSPSPVEANGVIYFAAKAGIGGGSIRPFPALLTSFDADRDGSLSREEFAAHSNSEFPKFDRDKNGIVTAKEYQGFEEFYRSTENAMLAIRLGGVGDVTESHVLWKADASLPHVPSVLVHQGQVHAIAHGGIATCYDAVTGKLRYRVRLPGQGYYFASPVAADSRVLMASAGGVVTVIQSGPALKVLDSSKFDEDILASPAIVDGMLYLRTSGHLYAFGKPRQATFAGQFVKPHWNTDAESDIFKIGTFKQADARGRPRGWTDLSAFELGAAKLTAAGRGTISLNSQKTGGKASLGATLEIPADTEHLTVMVRLRGPTIERGESDTAGGGVTFSLENEGKRRVLPRIDPNYSGYRDWRNIMHTIRVLPGESQLHVGISLVDASGALEVDNITVVPSRSDAEATAAQSKQLTLALDNDDPDAMAALIKEDPAMLEMRTGKEDNGTPLIRAAWKGSAKVAARLIELGADVEARDANWGNTPLRWCSWWGTYEVTAVLIEAGAEPRGAGRMAQTAKQSNRSARRPAADFDRITEMMRQYEARRNQRNP